MSRAPGQTLPRDARLLERGQFEAALAAGATRNQKHFALYVRPNDLGKARLGVITSKRVAPRAVDRNRVKRLVREAFRRSRHRLGGIDLVVLLRRRPRRDCGAEIAKLLDSLGGASDGR